MNKECTESVQIIGTIIVNSGKQLVVVMEKPDQENVLDFFDQDNLCIQTLESNIETIDHRVTQCNFNDELWIVYFALK